MTKDLWETEKIGNLAIVRGSEEELRSLRSILKSYLNVDIYGSINIEFVENEDKNLVEKYKALSYLKNCLDIPPLSIDDPSVYPELHTELADIKYEIPPIQEFNKLEMPVSCIMASFLVEVFCPNQQPEEKYLLEKRFFKQKTVYNLLIFASLPVSIEMVQLNNAPPYCLLKFADIKTDSNQITAEQIQEQVKFALRVFSVKCCCAFFRQVDISSLKTNRLEKISKELECAIIKTGNFEVYDTKGSFYLYVLPNLFGEDARNRIMFALQNLFGSIQLFQCERCHKYSTISKKEECTIQSFDQKDEDMVFDNHQLTNDSPSEFYFNVLPNV